MSDLDLPFESCEPTPLIDRQVNYSGGLVIAAAYVDLPDLGRRPALVFRFAKPDGSGFYTPVVLVQSDDQIAKLRPLIVEAVQAARRFAKGATS